MIKFDLYARVGADIEAHGRSVVSVFDDPAFSYSIGNALRGLPELLVLGLHPKDACGMINAWSNLMIEHRPFHDGELVDVGGSFPCMAIACDALVRAKYTIQAGQYLEREDYDVMQMLVPDKRGFFPEHSSCDPAYRMPVLRAAKRLQ